MRRLCPATAALAAVLCVPTNCRGPDVVERAEVGSDPRREYAGHSGNAASDKTTRLRLGPRIQPRSGGVNLLSDKGPRAGPAQYAIRNAPDGERRDARRRRRMA